jgi:hypothetical protein
MHHHTLHKQRLHFLFLLLMLCMVCRRRFLLY